MRDSSVMQHEQKGETEITQSSTVQEELLLKQRTTVATEAKMITYDRECFSMTLA